MHAYHPPAAPRPHPALSLPGVSLPIAVLALALASACQESTGPPPPEEEPADGPVLIVEGDTGAGPRPFRIPLDGGSPVPLFPAGTTATDPVPSPDGSRIAYVVANYDDLTGDVWIAGLDGSDPRLLTDAAALDDAPAWSPDGTRLAFRTFRSELLGEIWTCRDDGTALVNLTPQIGGGAVDHHHPAWSPDGARIAYAGTGGGDWGIWTMNADGSDKVQLTNTPDLDTEPTWSPDGQWIAFRRSSPGPESDILIVAAGGGEPTRLAMEGDQRMPAWSPDGELIAFVGAPARRAPPEVFTMRPDGTDVRQRTFAATWGTALSPSWSP